MNDYDPMKETWHRRGVRAADYGTRKPWRSGVLAYVGTTVGLILVTLMIVAVVVVCWQVGWIFSNADTNREAHQARNSYANQQTLRDQITQNIGNVLTITAQIAQDPEDAGPLEAQRIAIVNIVCGDAAQVAGDPLAPDQASFIKSNCYAGNIGPASPYSQR